MKQTLKYILDQMNLILRYAESKHSITLALCSGVIVFAVTFITRQNFFVIFLASASIVFCLISILYSFVALSARRVKIRKDKPKRENSNLMYYRDVCHYDEKSYIEAVRKSYKFPSDYKADSFDLDLAKQIISNAKVINKKFAYFNYSVMFLFVAITLLVVAICIVGSSYAS